MHISKAKKQLESSTYVIQTMIKIENHDQQQKPSQWNKKRNKNLSKHQKTIILQPIRKSVNKVPKNS